MKMAGPIPPMDTHRRWELIIHCFLDDSGKEGQITNPYVVMAGYFGEMDVWLELWKKWADLLLKHQISSIHMRDLIPIQGEYKSLGWDTAKRAAVVAEFIEVINKAPVIGVGIALETSAWRKIRKAHPDVKFGTAQEFCFQRILRRIIDRLHAAMLDGKVTLIFDRDPEFSANRIGLFNWVLEHDPRARELLVAITFADPTYYPGIQCADLLAWETRKEQIQKAGHHQSTRRWQRLFTAMPDYHLDYMGELWDEREFDKYIPEIIEAFRSGKVASPPVASSNRRP
jgi:hypothetical protein